MAKRYARLNWQNKPSVATPINATNLNKMDKGIDDCDNAIEEIYAKRVNNVVTTNTDTFLAGPVGKLLQDQITTINNDLAGDLLAKGSTSANANTLIKNAVYMWFLPDTYASFNYPADYGVIQVLSSGTGATHYIAQLAIGISGARVFMRTSHNGGTSWTAWTIVQ